MSKGIKILYVLPVAVCLLWSSCIRDSIPPCPPLQVTLTVKDKNYFNIDDAVKLGLMERKAENLPFRDYVSTLYYIVHDAEGKVVAEQKNTLVDNDDQTQLITLPESLPYGKYTLTVWGNMKSDEPLGEDATTAEMEAVGAAANDIYLASATFDYRYGNESIRWPWSVPRATCLSRLREFPITSTSPPKIYKTSTIL